MFNLSNFVILVVDDEPDMLEFITAVLEDHGATVFKARDGFTALAIAREQKPDLVTLDLQMPDLDGSQVFTEMRRDPRLRHIPVCIISGKPEFRQLIYQRDILPPEGYLDKPVDEKSILMNIRKILRQKQRSTRK